jgi:hypothetical protein
MSTTVEVPGILFCGKIRAMAIVFANTSLDPGGAVGSTHRMCAERLFLERAIEHARRQGVRKVRHMYVFRLTKAGELATSCPCALCRAQLILFDLLVTYVDDGGILVDRVHASQLPDGVSTSSQRLGRHLG